MPKTPRSSRWIHFSVVNNLDLENSIKKCGCNCSQWVIIDKIIEGYLFFQSNVPIPKKKQWIPGASYSFTTQEELKLKYSGLKTWSTYGSNPLFSNDEVVLPKSKLVNFITPKEAPPAFDKNDLIAYPIKVAGFNLSAHSVDCFLMESDDLVDYYTSLDFGQRDLLDSDLKIITSNLKLFWSTLIQAQIDNKNFS